MPKRGQAKSWWQKSTNKVQRDNRTKLAEMEVTKALELRRAHNLLEQQNLGLVKCSKGLSQTVSRLYCIVERYRSGTHLSQTVSRLGTQ